MNRCHFPQFDRHAEHLHTLGPRAVAEFLAELAGQISGGPAISRLLAEYRNRLAPAMIRAAGAERLPRRLSVLTGGAR